MMTRHLIVVYQPFMLLALKRWFPDFESHALALGGTIKPYDVSQYLSGLVLGDPAYIQPDARCLPKHANIPNDGGVPNSFYLMRVLFEPLLRRMTKERYSSIKFLRGTVTGIVLDTGKRRVTGVEYTGGKGGRVNLECALFVDCTGMARMGVKWLQKAGLPPPKIITYNPQLRYGSSKYFQGCLVCPEAIY
jgi:Tryptophan halogenase